MAGIKNLSTLLKSMKPELNKDKFVFCTTNKDLNISLIPKMIFNEKEGTTFIIRKEQADKNHLEYNGVWALITLTIHSDLNAVGFLAAITKKLAESNISVNAVSAYYHDHLFVPFEKSKQTMKLLQKISDK